MSNDRSTDESVKLEELERYSTKYKLSGKECPYILTYNKKKDRVILLGAKLESVLSGGTVTIRIPEIADEINCWNFLRMSNNVKDFWDVYLNKITKIVIYGNGKALFGKLDDILCVDIMNAPFTKSVTKTPKYRLDGVRNIEIHDFDFSNIQSIRFMASLKYASNNYSGWVEKLRLIRCKNLRAVPGDSYVKILESDDGSVDFSKLKIVGGCKELKSIFYDSENTADELEKSGKLAVFHPEIFDKTFIGCKNLKRIPRMDYSQCTDMISTFSDSDVEESLEISNVGYPVKLRTALEVFEHTTLKTVNIHDIEVDAQNHPVEYRAVFEYGLVEKVNIQNVKFINSSSFNFYRLFDNMRHLKEVTIRNVDFGDADVDISEMFSDLPELEKITLDGIKCKSLFIQRATIKYRFEPSWLLSGCDNLKNLDVKNIFVKEKPGKLYDSYRVASLLPKDEQKWHKLEMNVFMNYVKLVENKNLCPF